MNELANGIMALLNGGFYALMIFVVLCWLYSHFDN